MKKSLILVIIVILILVLFSYFYWMYEVKFITGRASINQATFSVDNSYLFISPLQAKANNQEKIRITIFILNNQGLGVMGKNVSLQNNKNLAIGSVQDKTDDYGKAVFDVSADKQGEYYLDVAIDRITLKQKAHLVFN